MTETSELPAFLAAPQRVIADAVAAAEPDLDTDMVDRIVVQVANTRTKLRKLAHALDTDPGLLVSGRPEGPKLVELLIRALRKAGSTRVVLPHCAGCGKQNPLRERDSHGRQICHPCANKQRTDYADCTGCGQTHLLVGRDRHGSPLCARCCDRRRQSDPLPGLLHRLTSLNTGLDPDALDQAVRAALPNIWQQRRAGWELDDHPDRLTTNPALGSSTRMVVLAEELLRRGATGIATPTCPFCRSTKRIRWGRNGMRCCRKCYEQPREIACGGCGKPTTPTMRTVDGDRLCATCYTRQPANQDRCSSCERTVFIVRRDDAGQYCHRCWRGVSTICSVCGNHKPCHYADTDAPICEHCTRKQRLATCSNCGADRPIWSRTNHGDPLCHTCSQRRELCAECGKNKHVASRTARGPLCSNCFARDPISFRSCENCGSIERLFHHGLCPRCAADRSLRALLTDDGTIPPRLTAIYDALSGSDPLRLLDWIAYSPAVPPLRRLLADQRPITHDALDELLPNRAVQAMRAALVAKNVLPARDEQLAALERWLPGFLNGIDHTANRQLLHSYATWHHLRILRRKTRSVPARPGQITAVRADLSRAAGLLAWLRKRNLDLASCRQADIDAFLAEGPPDRHRVGAFVRWAAANRRTRGIEVPTRYDVPRRAIEQDHRWVLTKLLVHDDDIDPTDRFAGLLVLLFGQSASKIVLLTADDVERATGAVTLKLGTNPVELPSPMDQLALQLLTDRRTHMQLGRVDDHTWLFPGGLPGTHLSAARLSRRLNRIGVNCRLGRNATMLEFAAELPSALVSKLLGVEVKTATRWTDHAGGVNARYAAEFSRRTTAASSTAR